MFWWWFAVQEWREGVEVRLGVSSAGRWELVLADGKGSGRSLVASCSVSTIKTNITNLIGLGYGCGGAVSSDERVGSICL